MPLPSGPGAARVAATAAFFGQGLVFITLTTRLPEIQRRFDLDPGIFSLFLLGMVLAAGVGSLLGESLAPARGSAMVLRLGFGVMVVAVPAIAMARSPLALAAAMIGYGITLGLVDAGTNMQGVAVEAALGRPVMPGMHAGWTLGGIAGTGLALAAHRADLAVLGAILAALPLLLVFAPYRPGGVRLDGTDPAVAVSVPWRRIGVAGLVLVLFYMADSAVTAWGPTYLDREFGASSQVVAVATLPYLLASLIGRVAGDGLTARFGAPTLVRAAAILGALGMAVVVFAPQPAVAMTGFFVLGAGLCVIAPLSFSAAAGIAREAVAAARVGSAGADSDHDAGVLSAAEQATVDAVVARFNQFNYCGALVGAVLTGAVGNDDLRLGFALPMILIVGILPLATAFRSAQGVAADQDGLASTR